MGLFSKIFGTYSQRQIKKILPTVDKIEALADEYKAKSDEELTAMTDTFKQRLAAGETLDDILPEAYALVREACDRVLGKRPFRVQLMGGVVLHQGRIAEMKTGEGKTIVATLPSYLNALAGKGVHIVTVNEYLARLGAEEMGRVYNFLGLTTGLVVHGQTRAEKQAAYQADITYGTNNEFGFDYLRDNMVVYQKDLTQRGHAFAIVDEVDSILIDEARTPLIISGEGEESTEMYDRTDRLVRGMKQFRIKEVDRKQSTDALEADPDADYIVDEKARTVVLTAKGVAKVEEYFGLANYSDPENATIAHHVTQAMKAYGIMKLDVDYLVKDNEVLIVDSFTGRIMPGRRFSDGLHQAIEAKERVKVQKENKTLATITFQNYFRMYEKLSGMTGTALTEEDEFSEIYGLDVVEIPTNMPMIRIDHNDEVYTTVNGKYNAIIRQVQACQAKGQPVLVGTVSIEKSEELSRRLKMQGIKHTVLNAKQHEREAEIVAMAGKKGRVTISTNMAGRGTDIMLGGNPEFLARQEMKKQGYDEDVIGLAVGSSVNVSEEVLAARVVYKELFAKYEAEIAPEKKEICDAGGLFIIGTERHESRRIDNQLRGRSGRQGDPGESRFYLSLEDDLMRLFGTGSERIGGMAARMGFGEDQPIAAGLLSGAIERAQKKLESINFERRKNVLSYDDVMNQQRNLIYAQRNEVLSGADLHEKILAMITGTVAQAVANFCSADRPEDWNFAELRNFFYGYLLTENDLVYTPEEIAHLKREDIEKTLCDKALARYGEKEVMFGDDLREVERVILLRCVDRAWMAHIDAMEDLKDSVYLNAYAQRSPVDEYRLQGADMFDMMVEEIRENTVRMLLSVVKRESAAPLRRESVAKVTSAGFEGQGNGTGAGRAKPAEAAKPKPQPYVRKTPKVGPNDPCPCGSGKKYKNCCGARD